MKDLIQNARAVEARLRGYSNTTINRFGHEGCDAINALITALEAAQPTFAIDGMTPSQFAMRELYEFQEATGCDTGAQAKGKLEAAQKDAERYRWLRDEAFNSFIVENMTVYPRHGLDAEIDAAIKAQGDAE